MFLRVSICSQASGGYWSKFKVVINTGMIVSYRPTPSGSLDGIGATYQIELLPTDPTASSATRLTVDAESFRKIEDAVKPV